MEELQEKVKVLKPVIDKIFSNLPVMEFLDTETLVLGFFYLFIYKDFLVREIIYKFTQTCQGDDTSINAIFLNKIKTSYDEFITNHFSGWMHLML